MNIIRIRFMYIIYDEIINNRNNDFKNYSFHMKKRIKLCVIVSYYCLEIFNIFVIHK